MTSNTSTALITGGTSGIGRATANKLAQLGIHILVVGRNAERGKKPVDEIRTVGGKADFISPDLRDAASGRDRIKRRCISRLGTHLTLVEGLIPLLSSIASVHNASSAIVNSAACAEEHIGTNGVFSKSAANICQGKPYLKTRITGF